MTIKYFKNSERNMHLELLTRATTVKKYEHEKIAFQLEFYYQKML